MPGTGGELARHLVRKFNLNDVTVEVTEQGDHYDPITRAVRLSKENYDGKSLTAVAVAAHEVGHAIQHHQGNAMFLWRGKLVGFAQQAQKLGAIAMFAIPVVMGIARAPSAGLFMFLIGILSMGVSTLVHLVTLPVEWDASFNKALPILREGRYIPASDEHAVKKVLKAAALTYLAGSLMSLLNLGRWIAILRRR